MFNHIRDHKASKWMIGIMLLGVTLSFPVSFFTLTGENQNRPRLAAMERTIGKPFSAKIAPDTQDNIISPKETNGIDQTATKFDQSTLTPSEPKEPSRNNPVTWVQNKQSTPVSGRSYPENQQNIYLLARVIHAEARGESLEGQVAVGAVLLNRLLDKRFPKTLSQIIFKRGEFCTVRDGQIWMAPSSKAIQAARLAVSGWDPTGGAVYFYNPAKTTSRWIWSRPVVNKIGNHFFAV